MSDTAQGRNTMLAAPHNSVQEIKLILTTTASAGCGERESPYRMLTQLWTPDGKLVAEWDPYGNEAREYKLPGARR